MEDCAPINKDFIFSCIYLPSSCRRLSVFSREYLDVIHFFIRIESNRKLIDFYFSAICEEIVIDARKEKVDSYF